jgi:hypothetical protein
MIRGSRRRARAGAILLALALASLAGPDRPAAAPSARAEDAPAGLDPATAYARARALGEQQHFFESLPYFRHALATPTPAWQPHADFAISLFHAALEGRMQRGALRPRVRSSHDRAKLLREAAEQLDQAEARASTGAERAIVRARRARHLAAFGFAWDARVEYLRAAPDAPEARARADDLLRALRDPLHAAR